MYTYLLLNHTYISLFSKTVFCLQFESNVLNGHKNLNAKCRHMLRGNDHNINDGIIWKPFCHLFKWQTRYSIPKVIKKALGESPLCDRDRVTTWIARVIAVPCYDEWKFDGRIIHQTVSELSSILSVLGNWKDNELTLISMISTFHYYHYCTVMCSNILIVKTTELHKGPIIVCFMSTVLFGKSQLNTNNLLNPWP